MSPLFSGVDWSLLVLYVAGSAVLTCSFTAAVPDKIERLQLLARCRWSFLVPALALLLLHLPLAEAVSPFPGWVNLALAAVLPVLGALSLDFYASRILGLLLIFAGYDLVHWSFDASLPGAPVFAVLSWLAGVAGIWISARPCSLRDWWRAAARRRTVRCASAAAAGIFTAALILFALLLRLGH